MSRSRIRVLFDARAITPRRSGIGEYSLQLCRALAEHAADTIDLHLFDGHRVHPVRVPADVSPACAGIHDGDLYRLRGHLRIGAVARAAGADLYHYPDFFAPLHPIGVPMAVTIHDVVPIAHPEYLGRSKKARFRGVFRAWARAAARKSRIVITDSEFSRGEILHHLGPISTPVRTIHLASAATVSPAPFPSQKTGGVRPGAYLLYVGRHDPYKGLPLLLDAYTAARQGGALGGIALVITGAVDARYDIRGEITRRGLEASVVCTDYIGSEELSALYREACALVLPSLYEGFGIPPLDAMLHGTPVLVSNRGSLPEIVGDAACICDPEDPVAFAAALVDMVENDSLRSQCIERGRRRSAAFSWKATAESTASAWIDVLHTARYR